jgi:hypothetical protein
VALLLVAGGAYYGMQSERASSAALRQAREENARLTAQLLESEKQNAAAGASSSAVGQHDPVSAGEAFLTDHPEIKEKISAWVNTLGARFAFRIAHEMNLSPGQSARLAELMNGRSSRLIHNAPGYGAVELRSGNWQSYSKRNEEIRDLLGEVNYEKFNELTVLDNIGADYNINGLGVASFSNDVSLASALYFTDVPLTSEQARSLEKIAGDLKKNHPGITDPQAHWNAFMKQAGSILSPGQMRALVAVGDRYVWKQTSEKWINDYDEARTVTTATHP